VNDLQKSRRDMMTRLRTFLRATRYFPQTKDLDGGSTMVDGKPYPPVPVSAAWTINSPTHGIIGMVLNTRWGYRATRYAGDWAGCWHTSRDLCRDWYAKDWFYDITDAKEWRDPAHAALTAAGVPLAFDHTYALRYLYCQGKSWQDAVASRVQHHQQQKVAWLNNAWDRMPKEWMHDQGVWCNLHLLHSKGYTVTAALEEIPKSLPRLVTP